MDGGFPDQAHFSIGLQQHNFAAYDWIDRTDNVLVDLGDQFGNPVHPNTAVYFTTTGGKVTAAGYTNNLGQATATLLSGNPLPQDAALGASNPSLYGSGTGYAWVSASTQGVSGSVSDSALVLFSATTAPITFNGASDTLSSVTIPANGSVNISVNISDRFGNPLEPNTTVATTVLFTPPEAPGMKFSVNASGLPSTLGDYLTRGYGHTDFTLTLQSSIQGAALTSPIPFSVTVTVSGRNGPMQGVITGVVTP